MSHIQIAFGKVVLRVATPADLHELQTIIKDRISALEPHFSALEFRYIDDEGDEIVVTTNDELDEAIRVGKLTKNGSLILQISVKNLDPSAAAAIETSIEVPVPPARKESPFIAAMDNATSRKKPVRSASPAFTDPTDILLSVRKAGEQALAQLNVGLDIAHSEILRLNTSLNEAHEAEIRTSEDLETVRKELDMTKKTNAEAQALLTSEVAALQVKLASVVHELTVEREEKMACEAKRAELESQTAEALQWKAKFLAAEQERENFKEQLDDLRAGLMRLTVSESDSNSKGLGATKTTELESPLTAEVLSMEPVDETIVEKIIEEPASPPPEYPRSVRISTVSERLSNAQLIQNEIPIPPVRSPKTAAPKTAACSGFPLDCPAPSETELKLQQLRNMGFDISLDELSRKLNEYNGDMTNVINSLL